MRRSNHNYRVVIDKDYDDPPGIDFTAELFDGIRYCSNRCAFCFVDNLPRGMRRTLYIKDDDYRLSFLHGNFVTLTNITEADVERIIQQRLSPLYVSVHATRASLRDDLMRSRGCVDILPLLRRLADSYIQFHTQIVLCPGVNDGPHMDQTIEDLATLYPAVMSVGVVPVGLTKYSKGDGSGRYSKQQAQAVLRQVDSWQKRLKKQLGTRLVFASDELYLLSEQAVPGVAAYEGYPQLENGIGIQRRFIDGMQRVARKLPESVERQVHVGLVTGRLAEPPIRQMADVLSSVGNVQVDVLPIDNDFFGHSVTVAGLITGQDIINQLHGRELPEVLFIPGVMLRDDAFLDDVTLEDVRSALGCKVVPIEPTPTDLAESILDLAQS